MSISIEELITETENYINSDICEDERSQAEMLLSELKRMKEDDQYMFSGSVMWSLLDSFDIFSDYWLDYFAKYSKAYSDRFEDLDKRFYSRK